MALKEHWIGIKIIPSEKAFLNALDLRSLLKLATSWDGIGEPHNLLFYLQIPIILAEILYDLSSKNIWLHVNMSFLLSNRGIVCGGCAA